MARKTAIITITAEGRDQGKVFHIQEQSAEAIEYWAMRALLALSHVDVDKIKADVFDNVPFFAMLRNGETIPPDVLRSGLAGVAAIGLRAFSALSIDEAKPLLDELMGCVSVIPDPKNLTFMRRDVMGDIEEATTLVRLKAEVFNLHASFLPPAVTSTSTSTTGKTGQAPTPSTRTPRRR